MEDLKKEIEYLREIIAKQEELIRELQRNKQYNPWYPPQQYPWVDPYKEEPYRPMKIWYSNGSNNLNMQGQ